MRLPSRMFSAALCVVIVLLPPLRRPSGRDVERDVRGLRRAECQYRGITATFEDVTRAYVLETYARGELVDWEGTPSRSNPDSETLVTAWYRVGEAKPVTEAIVPDSIRALRRSARRRIPMTWRYSTLATVRIDAANDYARDAIAVFRLTVDRFIRAMVVAQSAMSLRQTPNPEGAVAYAVVGGTVLLREDPPGTASPLPSGWSYVRIPSTSHRGWVRTEQLKPVENEQ